MPPQSGMAAHAFERPPRFSVGETTSHTIVEYKKGNRGVRMTWGYIVIPP